MTNDEKAQYYDQWHEYFEPLARIRREVLKSHKNFSHIFIGSTDFWTDMIKRDPEVQPEIENLIRTILEEENE